MSQLVASCRRDLLEIYRHSLDAIRPERLIKNVIGFDNANLLIKNPIDFNEKPIVFSLKNRKIHVIGGGKCALAMAKGLAESAIPSQMAGHFGHGCLSIPSISKMVLEKDINIQSSLDSINIKCNFGSKDNLPDEDSVRATKYMLDQVREVCKTDRDRNLNSLFLVLISGGGSACLTSPRYVCLKEKIAIIKQLVQKGANIVELNKVRRYLSNVKGGNLARYIKRCNPDAHIISLILSDIINDPIEFISSGPTFIENNCDFKQSMIDVLQKYELDIPEAVDDKIFKQDQVEDGFVLNRLIGSNLLALRAADEKSKELGYKTRILGHDISGETSDIVRKLLVESFTADGQDKSMLICGGETTVTRQKHESWGIGGRTQEMALDYMIEKLSNLSLASDKHIVDFFFAGSTDGQDGPTDVAGCMASFAQWSMDNKFDICDLIEAKSRHDTYTFWSHRKPDWLVKVGPTGSNVMDLYFLATVKVAC